MKMFQAIREHYAYMGVTPLENRAQSVLNKNNMITLIILFQGLITTNVYLFFGAKTFNEYVDSFWVSCSTTLACVNFVILILQTPNVFDFMDEFEVIIQKRKSISKISLKILSKNTMPF